ncbi:Amino-acid permease BAT1 [Fusarium oxysporum f. sp. albedinis]|nr:Amino-acid permease BAT1 [Fusarium oxysporum f. sp. albedinis]
MYLACTNQPLAQYRARGGCWILATPGPVNLIPSSTNQAEGVRPEKKMTHADQVPGSRNRNIPHLNEAVRMIVADLPVLLNEQRQARHQNPEFLSLRRLMFGILVQAW